MFNSQSYTLPIVISACLHGVVLFLIAFGWEATSEERKITVPRYVPATLIQMEKTAPKAEIKPQPRTIDLAAQREEKQRQAEAQRQAQVKKEQSERARKEKEAKELREKELAENRRRDEAERERQRQQQREQELANALAEEEALIQSEEDAVLAQSYTSIIHDRIQRNWDRPLSARNGMYCDLTINFVPTGRIVGVTVTECTGDAALNRSAEQAVWKTEQITELREMPATVFERNFRTVPIRLVVTNSRL